MTGWAGTVVIAAHNEEAVIARCLGTLAEATRSGLIDVIVVCNGCTDATVRIAQRFDRVTVLDVAKASKVGALRRGDAIARDGARIYLDADILLTSRAAVALLEALGSGAALAGRPPLRFDYDGASRAIRSWYRVREKLPSIQRALWGAGCYGLSVTGRARFGEFPDIVSDDLFVDSLFRQSEISILETDPVIVRTPRRVADLVRILQRSYRTQREVISPSSAIVSHGQRGQFRDLAGIVRRQPWWIPKVAVYVAVIAYARVRARFASPSGWERDTSSREPSGSVR